VADVSVRPASLSDASEIGRIQFETWRVGYAEVLPKPVVDALDPVMMETAWRMAVQSPPSPRHRVVVASEAAQLVGFAAFGPDDDPQAADPSPETTTAITTLLVEPRWGRRGHGSRLLAAVTDLARDAGSHRLIAWVPAKDTASLEFYRSTGWAADGVQRSLDTGAGLIVELRLHTSLNWEPEENS